MADYQVIIIGGGPAGLTAGLYTSRSLLKTLLLERAIPGGQITESVRVENYPGFPHGISGMELGELMAEQAKKFGLEMQSSEVTSVNIGGEWKGVETAEASYRARAVIIATGGSHRKLDVVGEAELAGRGVSYCATCDGPLFREQEVAVVGGGDAAVDDALYLTRFASKVFLIHRRHQLRATPLLQERAMAEPKLNFLWERVVQAIRGEDRVLGLDLVQAATKDSSYLPVSGVFIAIGIDPATAFLGGQLPLSPSGHIIVNESMETAVAGVFAVGDVRQNSPGQVVCAAADGAIAALSTQRFLQGR